MTNSRIYLPKTYYKDIPTLPHWELIIGKEAIDNSLSGLARMVGTAGHTTKNQLWMCTAHRPQWIALKNFGIKPEIIAITVSDGHPCIMTRHRMEVIALLHEDVCNTCMRMRAEYKNMNDVTMVSVEGLPEINGHPVPRGN